jgi:hypothetical protein
MTFSTSIMIHHQFLTVSRKLLWNRISTGPYLSDARLFRRQPSLREHPPGQRARGPSPAIPTVFQIAKSEKSSEGLRLRSSSPRKLGEFELLGRVGPAHEHFVRVKRFCAGLPHSVYRSKIAGDRP